MKEVIVSVRTGFGAIGGPLYPARPLRLVFLAGLVAFQAGTTSVHANEEADSVEDVFSLYLDDGDVIVTSASKRPTTVVEAPANVTVFTRRHIRRLGLRTLSDLLRMVPGFSTATDPTGVQRWVVRGRGNDGSNGVKLLLNGHSLNEPFTGGALLAFDNRPLDDVKRVEVIRGPGSALFGANAFVGIVSITTRDDEAVTVSGYGDTHTSKGLSGHVAEEIFGIRALGQVSYRDSQGHQPIVDADRLSGSALAAQSLTPGKADSRYSRLDSRVSLQWRWFEVTVGYIDGNRGDFAGSAFCLTADPAHPDDISKVHFKQLLNELKFDLPLFDDSLTLHARLFDDHVEQDLNLRLTPLDFRVHTDLDGDGVDEVFPKGKRRRRHLKMQMLGGSIGVAWKSFEGNEVNAGYVYEIHRILDALQQANFDPEIGAVLPGGMRRVADFTEPSYDREIVAAYLEDVWSPWDSVTLTAGVRADRYNDFGWAVSPRAAAVLAPWNSVRIKALYGHAFRAPSFDELFLRGDRDIIGNPLLEPEELDTGEIVVAYQSESLNEIISSLTVRGTSFVTKLAGAVGPMPRLHESGPARLGNVESMVFAGGELELDIGIARLLSVGGNTTFQYPWNQTEKQKIANVPTFLSNMRVHVLPWEGAYLAVGASVEGPRARPSGDNVNAATGAIIYKGRANPLGPNVNLWIAAGILDFTLKQYRFSASLRVDNLANLDNADPTPALTEPGGLTFPGDLPREGITFSLTLTAEFDLEEEDARRDGSSDAESSDEGDSWGSGRLETRPTSRP